MKYIIQFIQYATLLFIFLIPWQARWLLSIGRINGGEWEYGTQSLYASEILLAAILVAVIVKFFMTRAWRETPVRERFNLRRLWTPAGVLLLFLIYAGISVFWAIDKNTAFIHWRFLVEAAVVFLVLSSGVVKWNRIVWVIILSAVVQVGFAVAQSNMQYIPASTELGMAAQSASDLGVSVVETVGGRWLRAYGSFPHPNILGGWLVLGLAAIVGLWREKKFQVISNKVQVFVFPICFIILLFGLLLTFSRSAWLAMFLVTCFLLLLGFRNRERLLFTCKLIALTVVTIAIFAATFPDPFLSRLRLSGFHLRQDYGGQVGGQARFSSNRLEVKSQTERVASWQEGMEIIKKHPLLGVGIGNYGLAVHRDIDSAQPAWYYQPAHNVFLLIWSELGFIGIFIIVAFFILSLRGVSSTLRATRQSRGYILGLLRFARNDILWLFLLPLLMLSLFDHYFWSLYPGMMIGAVYLGLILAKNKLEAPNLA